MKERLFQFLYLWSNFNQVDDYVEMKEEKIYCNGRV
jgi:hypothetical protein